MIKSRKIEIECPYCAELKLFRPTVEFWDNDMDRKYNICCDRCLKTYVIYLIDGIWESDAI